MKISVLATVLAPGALALAAPLVAQQRASDGVDCIAQAHDSATSEEIDGLLSGVDLDSEDEGEAAFERFVTLILPAASLCVESNRWTEEHLTAATMFETGRLSEAMVRRSGGLSARDLEAFDTALATDEHTALWMAMDGAVAHGLRDEAELSDDTIGTMMRDDPRMLEFIAKAGLPADPALMERIIMLLGALALQRMGAREFAALNGGN